MRSSNGVLQSLKKKASRAGSSNLSNVNVLEHTLQVLKKAASINRENIQTYSRSKYVKLKVFEAVQQNSAETTKDPLTESLSTKAKGFSKSKPIAFDFNHTITSDDIEYLPIVPKDQGTQEIPRLAHNLSRVLFQPNSYHQLQDTRTRVYNFQPTLQKMIPYNKFDFNKVSTFVPSEKDPTLLDLAKNTPKVRFVSLTSSMTGLLCQLHFFLSRLRKPDILSLLRGHPADSPSYSFGLRSAESVVVKLKDSKRQIFSIDADRLCKTELILSIMGIPFEKLLVSLPEEFSKYARDSSTQTEPETDSYHHAKIGSFLIRSQLDCHDPRLPGTGSFDLKSRAVCAIRSDLKYVQADGCATGYQLHQHHGLYESYEREKYDLIRLTLLKYLMQVRLGNMDGIFLCYHNIEKVFGFEYVPLEEMDRILHSPVAAKKDVFKNENEEDMLLHENRVAVPLVEELLLLDSDSKIPTCTAQQEFILSFRLLEEIFYKIQTEYMSNHPDCLAFRLSFKGIQDKLYVTFVPLTSSQVDAVQGIKSKVAPGCRNAEVDAKLDEKKYQEALELTRQRFNDSLHETMDNAYGFTVTCGHKINGQVLGKLEKPNVNEGDKWEVGYDIAPMDDEAARKMYLRLVNEKASMAWGPFQTSQIRESLREVSKLGREREKHWEDLDQGRPKVVWQPDA